MKRALSLLALGMALPGLTPDQESRGARCYERVHLLPAGRLALRPELDTTLLAVRAVNRQVEVRMLGESRRQEYEP